MNEHSENGSVGGAKKQCDGIYGFKLNNAKASGAT